MKTPAPREFAMVAGGWTLLIASAIGCGKVDDEASTDASSLTDGALSADAPSSPGAQLLPDGGTDPSGRACATATDCADGYACVFPIAEHCSATSVCIAIPHVVCDLEQIACACDGGAASVPCYFDGESVGGGASGYATAPITGFATNGPCPL